MPLEIKWVIVKTIPQQKVLYKEEKIYTTIGKVSKSLSL